MGGDEERAESAKSVPMERYSDTAVSVSDAGGEGGASAIRRIAAAEDNDEPAAALASRRRALGVRISAAT